MAAKRWKHQLSRAIPSFQLCRDANHRNSIIAASIYRLSPVNPKSFDITYPSFSGATAVPPSTPEDTSFTAPPPRRSASSRASRLNPHHQEGSSSPEFQSKNEKNRQEEISTCRDGSGTAKSSNSIWKKAWESTDTETLLSPETSRSFSEDWSSTTSTDLLTERSRGSTDRKQPPSRVVPNPAETVAVVKRSENPLEDFKSSMWEVVVEKRLVKPNDLEQLLLSFLSLNSRRYHGVIVEAFSEIWRALFSDHGHLPDL